MFTASASGLEDLVAIVEHLALTYGEREDLFVEVTTATSPSARTAPDA